MHFDIELTQSEKVDLLPTEVKYKSRIEFAPNAFSHMRIEWKRDRRVDNYLPSRVQAAEGIGDGDGTVQHTMIFDWRIGDEVGDELFNWELEDNRLPFSKYFDFQFDVWGGTRIIHGTQWEAPDGLFPNDETKR